MLFMIINSMAKNKSGEPESNKKTKEKKEQMLGISVKKEENFSEWYSQVVFKTNLADVRYGLQGFIVHREWGMMILKKIYSLLEEEVEKDEHLPVLFPIAIPEKFFEKEKEHVQGFAPEVFWVTEAGKEKLNEKFALRPTSETAFYSMYSLWIRSWKDLPFKRYQSRICVYRYESTTRPFLRGREFLFFETHDVFKTHEDALKQVEKDMEIMKNIVENKLFIPFLFFKRPKWDKFAGAEDTYAADCVMPDGKISQIGSTHDLGQRFSKAFDVSYLDEKGKKKYAYITCFGPGIWRIMAALISIHGDDHGLVLPSCVAPYQIVIIPIYFKGKENEIDEYSEKVKEILIKNGFSIYYDNDKDKTAGFKFNKWEMMGVPLRIEIGPNEVESNQVVIVRRKDKLKSTCPLDELVEKVKEELHKNDDLIKKDSKKYHLVRECNSLEEIKELFEKDDLKGFLKVPFCDDDSKGEKCAEKLKNMFSLHVRGTLLNENSLLEDKKCIVCGKKAKKIVYLAKSY